MIRPTPLALAVSLLSAPALADDLTEARFKAMAETVFRPVIDSYDIPGIAIGLSFQGKTFVYTDGLANRETGQPVDADTLFELGSNSKLFTATLATLADHKGLLSLQDPVSTALPDLAGSAFDKITLADLAAHATGGLPLQVPDQVTDRASLLDYLAHWQPEAVPQTQRSYSNISIGLLGLIAADSFGDSFAKALQDEVLAPLRLDSTFVTVPPSALPRYAFGYSRDDNRPVRVNPGQLDAEAYGIKTSVTDMLRFLDAHLGLVAPDADLTAALAPALERTRLAGYDTAHYAQAMIWEGYGWPVTAKDLADGTAPEVYFSPQPMRQRAAGALTEAPYLTKTGSTNGFGSYVALLPAKGLAIVVLANRNYPNQVRATATLDLVERVLAAAAKDG